MSTYCQPFSYSPWARSSGVATGSLPLRYPARGPEFLSRHGAVGADVLPLSLEACEDR